MCAIVTFFIEEAVLKTGIKPSTHFLFKFDFSLDLSFYFCLLEQAQRVVIYFVKSGGVCGKLMRFNRVESTDRL